jgi:GntR family transcriptional repressor for pyruvate dehydrogenase complex
MPDKRSHQVLPVDSSAADLVVAHVRRLIVQGKLLRGSRLRTERELCHDLKLSRTSVRAGIQSLVAKGVLTSRRGAGTFVVDRPPVLDVEALTLFAALHGVSLQEMFETRRALEVKAVGIAAKRATSDDFAAISDAVTGMFAAIADPLAFLVCDITFHRAVASASGNRVLASMIEMVSAIFYERRRETVDRDRDLRPTAETHHAIYQAIRTRNAPLAERLMNEHLLAAEKAQIAEGDPVGDGNEEKR